MGQYWKPVNLDKCEYIDPHKLGSGLKLREQFGTHPGTGVALLMLLAAMPEARGGGDPQPNSIIGRWAGDRVALVGDYTVDADLPEHPGVGDIYQRCCGSTEGAYTDITDAVCAMIEREFEGKFVGDGWRDFVRHT